MRVLTTMLLLIACPRFCGCDGGHAGQPGELPKVEVDTLKTPDKDTEANEP